MDLTEMKQSFSLSEIRKKALSEISKVQSLEDLEKIRINYFGRKQGHLGTISEQLPTLSNEKKKELGKQLNEVKTELLKALENARKKFTVEGKQEWLDISASSIKPSFGHLHPITKVMGEVRDIFHYLGFSFVDGPEVELDLYNFQKLRITPDHPARDTQQTYYVLPEPKVSSASLNNNLLLRTHTSSMQVRYMETHKPPIRVMFPGRVYRRDQIDATHLPSFYQIEGLQVDDKMNMTNLVGVLDYFAKKLFGSGAKIRVYGHHFPYTEPSVEIEVYYPKIKKWVEILGGGMVHPEVLKNGHIDPNKYRGWAFGMGADRIAIIKYGIEDIRLMYSGDLRFLEQF